MRRTCWIAILAATISGCEDPSVDVLPERSSASLYDDEGKAVAVEVASKDASGGAILRTVNLPTKTRVIVLEDLAAEPPVSPALRLVKIQVDEGKEKGLVGGVNRQELRPEK